MYIHGYGVYGVHITLLLLWLHWYGANGVPNLAATIDIYIVNN